jgi:hypothetical protein
MNSKSLAKRNWMAIIRTEIINNWLNHKRKRFWGIVALILYTIIGFALVPVVVKNNLIDLAHDDFNRTAQIEQVEFNPYFLRLRIRGFNLLDVDNEPLISFDHFSINFQLSSLFRWAWTFDEISLDGLFFLIERFDENHSRLSNLLADDSPADGSVDDSGLPRFLIHELAITNGRVKLKDNLPATPVEFSIAPLDLSIQELNSLPDLTGRQSVKMQLPQGGSLEWTGSLELAPLKSAGQVALGDIKPGVAIAYLESMLPLESIEAVISGEFQYEVSQEADGAIHVGLEQLDIEVVDLAVRGLSPSSEFLVIKQISLTGGSLSSLDQTVKFDRLQLSDPRVELWLDKTGQLNLEQLMISGPKQNQPANSDWLVSLSELSLTNGAIDITNFGTEPAAEFGIASLDINMSQITNEDDARFPTTLSASIEGSGKLQIDATLGVLPNPSFRGSTNLLEIPLAPSHPYVQEFLNVNFQSGSIDSNIEWTLEQKKAPMARGSFSIQNLGITDGIDNSRILGWKSLDIDQFELDLNENQIQLSALEINELFTRIIINTDQSTNMSRLIVNASDIEEPVGNNEGSEIEFNLIVGGVRIKNSTLDMADFSLPLPFATHVTGLDGTVSTISTLSNEPANLRLEGIVDEYGLARIEGSMTVFDPTVMTNIFLEFRNLKMSNLSPYTVDFAGRKIDSGNLRLALGYGIEAGMLVGSNDVTLSDLVLGEKVDHPDATQLPLGLAVALLTNSDGVIDIDLPVSGDVNDPEFEIGGVIWKAFTKLITKLASAPFRLLGSLIGIDSEDLGEFEFLAGRSDLSPPELEKIGQLTEALKKRPELKIDIAGVSNIALDTPALKLTALRQKVMSQLGDEESSRGTDMMLDADIQSILENLMIESEPSFSLEALKKSHITTPADKSEGNPVFDSLSYSAALRDQLLQREDVSESKLIQLAEARARAIQIAFMSTGELNEERIRLIETLKVESEDNQWIKLALSISSN